VARREISERLGAKSFYAATALLLLVILGVGVLYRLVDNGPDRIEVGVTAAAPAALSESVVATAEAAGREAVVEAFPDEAAARTALEEGEVDVVILPASSQALFADEVDDETLGIVQQATAGADLEASLREAGLSNEQIAAALAVEPLKATTLSGDDQDNEGLEVLVGTAAGVLLFISIQMFGTYVLTGVVEEKSTAVVEVMLVRARPDQLLAGKVIGIGAAAMLQFFAAVAASLAALRISGTEVPGEIWATVPMTLVWFLGGYVLYSTLFALAGSLVSRQEDAQAAATPINTVLIGSYLLIFFFGYTPDSTASTVMSMIPPMAPFLMPMRMAAGSATGVEVAVALVLLLVSIVAVWKLAAKIFEQVLLRRGTRIGWRDAAALVRAR
jgi:ABC-2 type transport system permease protein